MQIVFKHLKNLICFQKQHSSFSSDMAELRLISETPLLRPMLSFFVFCFVVVVVFLGGGGLFVCFFN